VDAAAQIIHPRARGEADRVINIPAKVQIANIDAYALRPGVYYTKIHYIKAITRAGMLHRTSRMDSRPRNPPIA
jgi:hypothetical protein